MSIPEAVGLVLQAATLGEQGTIYLLEMGEQIKLVDLARNLIRLSGHLPDKEILINFVGLRPGEKLEEELIGYGENAIPSSLEKILKLRSDVAPDAGLFDKISEVGETSLINDPQLVLKQLQQLVPTFCPKDIVDQSTSTIRQVSHHDSTLTNEMKRILIVDDDLDARNAFSAILQSRGYVCKEAEHSTIDFEWLEREQIDLVIADNDKIPVLADLDFLERLKGKAGVSPQFVMVVTGHLAEQDKAKALKAGVRAVFHKPSEFNKILPAIERILQE